MNSGLVSWLLGGALVASLIWNVRIASTADGSACGSCAAESCSLDPGALAPHEARELERLAAEGCKKSSEFEARAGERGDELRRELERGDAERARALAREIAGLRGSALEHCVESVLALREHLTQAQLEGLLRSCWGDSCARR